MLEFDRLSQAQQLLQDHIPSFGPNKKREIIRLLYEISKREQKAPSSLWIEIKYAVPRFTFSAVKQYLVKRRYPFAFNTIKKHSLYLPELYLSQETMVDTTHMFYSPDTLYIEQEISNTSFVQRIKKALPHAKVTYISTLKEYTLSHTHFSLKEYNQRRSSLFLIQQKDSLFTPCPCTKHAARCGYHTMNLGYGCIFDCTYCFLQHYTNSPGIILPVNHDMYFDYFQRYKRPGMRLGTGEFTDSLALDWLTGWSTELIGYFSRIPEVMFELKTKSNCIENVLTIDPPKNIVIGWSLNTPRMIKENEFFTASLEERLCAAAQCAKAGYKIAFHFDPVLHYEGWEKEYPLVIEEVCSRIPPDSVAWISIGTLRMHPKLKPIIEQRFPTQTILNEELFIDFDGKLRYPSSLRVKMYRLFTEMLRKYFKNTYIYLCMEHL